MCLLRVCAGMFVGLCVVVCAGVCASVYFNVEHIKWVNRRTAKLDTLKNAADSMQI